MFWSALLLSIAALVADYAVWRRRIRCGRFAAYRKAYAAFVLTTDLLPGVVPVVLALCRDNGTAGLLFAQWCFFAFLITVVPRIVFYLFLALRMPRIGALLAAASVAVLLVGATRGRHAFRTEEVVIRSERLPAGFDGFRIVQFSDTHIGRWGGPPSRSDRLQRRSGEHPLYRARLRGHAHSGRAAGAVRSGVVRRQPRHRLLHQGFDLASGRGQPRPADRPAARDGVAGAGRRLRIARPRRRYHHGFGAVVQPPRNLRHAFLLPEYDISAAYDSIPDRLFNITVSHLPQLWPNITALGYGDLTLSGHVHSMQMKLRLGDRRFSPAQWMYEQWSGLYEERGRYLYINDGIGCVGFPMRLGAARPEITLITLRR